MSTSPTRAVTSGRRIVDRRPGPETDGVLVRPISGQIYLIEEGDLEWSSGDGTESPLSGLISRH